MSGHKWHFYDETERRKWHNPEDILQTLGLREGQTLIDLGCGQGFFTLPAARLVGPQGKVYAVDSSSESMAILEDKARAAGLTNIDFSVQEAEDSLPCAGCADCVFLGIVLHDFRDPLKVLRNARVMLKESGRLANLDWKKESTPLGPPLAKRFDVETASGLILQAGFTLEGVRDSGPYSYLITARK